MSRIRDIEDARAAAPRAEAREEIFRRARRHSRRVRVLKIALPAAAVIAAAAFMGATRYASLGGDLAFGMSGVTVADGKIVMAYPKLEGVNRENLPYRVTADRAIQEGLADGPVRLEGIVARLPFNADTFADLNADSAVYNRKRNTIVFDSVLDIATTDGMTARLNTARVDMDEGSLSTNKAVVIRRDGADIQARSLKVLENGKIFIFERKVRMNITPRQTQAAQERTGGQNGG